MTATNTARASSDNSSGKAHYDREIDARGLSCPLPMLSTRKSVDSLQHGEVLKVISTDKGSVSYFQSFARQTDLELVSWHEQEGEFRFLLRKT